MDNDGQWDLRMPPARYLLHHRRGTHADLARQLVKTDLDKTRRRRLTLLKLSFIAFNVLSEHIGKDMKGATTFEAVVKEWISYRARHDIHYAESTVMPSSLRASASPWPCSVLHSA